MPKLVLFDVDGTVLRHGYQEATERVADAVGRAIQEGSRFAPVTSRTARMMGGLANQLQLQDLGVLDGGATIYDFATDMQDQKRSRWTSPAKTHHILTVISRYCSEAYYGEDSRRYQPDQADSISSPSVFAVYPNESRQNIDRALSAVGGISSRHNRYEDSAIYSCIQVVAQGVDKRSGAAILLSDRRYVGFLPNDIVAIGDGEPDKDLFSAIPKEGRRIAVGDNTTLTARADSVVPSADGDGFALALERYVIGT